MFRRTRYLLWAALFLWLMVLGPKADFWDWTWPLVSAGSLLIVSEYLVQRYPSFGGKLAVTAIGLAFVFHSLYSFLPWCRDNFRLLTFSIERRIRATELETAAQIDPCLVEARRQLLQYVWRMEDGEGRRLQLELNELVEKARRGDFREEDRIRERQILVGLVELGARQSQFRSVIQRCEADSDLLSQVRPRGIVISGDPRGFEFFDSVKGKPKVWYYRWPEGRFDFFDKAGFHPTTWEELRPVTFDVVMEIIKAHDEVRSSREGEGRRLEAEDRQRKRAQYLEDYLNVAIRNRAGVREAAILMLGGTDHPSSIVEEEFQSGLMGRGVHPIQDLFKPAFVTEGKAHRLMSGDWSELRDLAVHERVDYLFVVNSAMTYAPTSQAEGLLSGTLEIELKCYDAVGQKPCGSKTFHVRGAGFTRADALQVAVSNLKPQLVAYLQEIF